MKIYYIANVRIPTEKAHGYQIGKMCEEFSQSGAAVELWLPTRKNKITDDLFDFYGLKKIFSVRYVKIPDFIRFSPYLKYFSFYMQGVAFLFKLNNLINKIDRGAIVYTRSPEIAWLCSLKGKKTFFEAHSWPNSKKRLLNFFLKKTAGIICNSNGTADKYKEADFSKILISPNGFDSDKFTAYEDAGQWRKELNLPQDKKIVMYLGHLYPWKGVDTIINAAESLLSFSGIAFVIIGGREKELEKYKKIIQEKKLNNIYFAGQKNHSIIPQYLSCANVLLLPNLPSSPESIKYTSPIKLFEYMASKRPIIASDLPSVREILNENSCVFFEPANANNLAEKITLVLNNNVLAKTLSDNAFRESVKYSWDKRAKNILIFFKS